MFLWVTKPVITAQKLFIYKLRLPGAQSRICFSFCNWCDCSFCSKLPAGATAEIFCKLTTLFFFFLTGKLKDQLSATKTTAKWCLLIQIFYSAFLRCCQKSSTCTSAGAHQRHWKCKESLNTAPLKHGHGKEFAEHLCGTSGFPLLPWRTGRVSWSPAFKQQVKYTFIQQSGFSRDLKLSF